MTTSNRVSIYRTSLRIVKDCPYFVAWTKSNLSDALTCAGSTISSYVGIVDSGVEGLYEEQVYTGETAIISPAFGTLELTAMQVLQGC